MKLAILGATGMLGQALCKAAKGRGFDCVGVSRRGADQNLDITDDRSLEEFLRLGGFNAVVNCCAIVNHAACDADPEAAYRLNSRPSAILARLSEELNFRYVYVSTDGYFHGDGRAKHGESARVRLLNEYARTKFAGEGFSLTNPASLVVRTNIVGFRGDADRPTFVEWAIDALRNGKPMNLFSDYYTSSISVSQFSGILFDLMDVGCRGLVNVASSEVSSKEEFIRALAAEFGFGLGNATVGSVTSLGSKRADSLGLDVSLAESLLGYRLPGMRDVIAQLGRDYNE